ncbi:MAG: hypothetical protein R3A48_23225, partial [Polyangiales bacterium]
MRRPVWLLAWVAILAACSGDSVVGGIDSGGDASLDVATDTGSFDAGASDVVDAGASDVVDAGPPRCLSNDDCRGNELGLTVCDVPSGRCVACSPSADTCPAGQFCDGATFRCAPGCRNDDGCAPGVVDGGVVSDGGVSATRCDVATRRCVACVTDSHCPAGLVCAGNQCVAGCNPTQPCPSGRTCCDGACIDPQDNTAHCGGCGMMCAAPNGAPACVAGACAVGSCVGSFGDCDGTASNGCETDTSTSVAHCGGCGMACAARANATASCAAGSCAYTCEMGFADCDGDPSNGCEVDTRTTVTACGMCGNVCPATNGAPSCVAGVCALTCNMGFADCDGTPSNGCEVDTNTALTHCGACNNACPARANATSTCAMGACGFT